MPSVGSISKRPGRPKPWRVRYRDPDGVERNRSFERRIDAQRFLESVRSDVITGRYVDDRKGRTTFAEYVELWRPRQMHRPATEQHLDGHLRRHILPTLGTRPLGVIRKSELQAWVKGLSATLAPATVKVSSAWVGTILRAAVDDGYLAASPMRGIVLPKQQRAQVVPITTEQVHTLAEHIPARYRAVILVGAGTGLRQGELFGLTLDRVDFLARRLRVDRQLVVVKGEGPTLGPPKSEASFRSVPLADVVLETLAEHVRVFPPVAGYVFGDERGRPVTRSRWGVIWRPAATVAGLDLGVGLHALRHYFASVLIASGQSVKAVQSVLGHASADETLNTYAHLWPDSDDRVRAALDDVFRIPAAQERPKSGPSGR